MSSKAEQTDTENGANVAFLKGSNQFHAKEEEEECFYTLCTKYVGCWGKLTCGRFKDRNHAVLCYLFSAMMVTIFIAIIFPLVSLTFLLLVDITINSLLLPSLFSSSIVSLTLKSMVKLSSILLVHQVMNLGKPMFMVLDLMILRFTTICISSIYKIPTQ